MLGVSQEKHATISVATGHLLHPEKAKRSKNKIVTPQRNTQLKRSPKNAVPSSPPSPNTVLHHLHAIELSEMMSSPDEITSLNSPGATSPPLSSPRSMEMTIITRDGEEDIKQTKSVQFAQSILHSSPTPQKEEEKEKEKEEDDEDINGSELRIAISSHVKNDSMSSDYVPKTQGLPDSFVC